MPASQVGTLLLQISHLASSEEDLCVSEPILVVVDQPGPYNIRASRFAIPVDDFSSFAKKSVAVVEVIIGPARWKTCSGNSDSFQHSARSELLNDLSRLPLEWFLALVGLDATYVMWRRRVQGSD